MAIRKYFDEHCFKFSIIFEISNKLYSHITKLKAKYESLNYLYITQNIVDCIENYNTCIKD